jgi:enterochelin esterase family protein
MRATQNAVILVIALLSGALPALGQGFQDFINHIHALPADQRPALVDSLMANLPGGATPIREADRAWFLYRGTASTLALAGDMTGWQPDLALSLIGGTDLWYRGFLCEEDARLDYKFVRNGSQWILDPLNPLTCNGGFGPNSELAMPAYVQPPEILNQGLPAGTLVTWNNFHSPQLGNTRTIQILLPPGHVEGQARGVCLVHDGLEYLSLAYLRNVVAWLANEHPTLELPIFVCVPPVNRTAEYQTTQQAAFGLFIAETVVPAVRAAWATHEDPARWITLGASNGGNISAYLLGEFPLIFGRGILMSPYLPQAQQNRLAALSPDSLRLYLNWGSYDLDAIRPLAEQTAELLEARGVPHLARVYHEGHSWGLWRATIDEGLLFVLEAETALPRSDGGVRPGRLDLRAWPNPFNSTLSVSLDGMGSAHLRLFDGLGRLRQEREMPAHRQVLSWEMDTLPTGRYWIEARRGQARGLTSVTLVR